MTICNIRNTFGRLIIVASVVLVGPTFAQFADLTINAIDIAPTNPSPGQDITVTVRAANIGNAIPAQPVTLYLYEDSQAEPMQCLFDQFQTLEVAFPPGTERLFTFTVQYPTGGIHRLWAWIDACESIVPEWDETNNSLSRDIPVAVGDLSILGIEPGVVDPVPGQSFMVNVFVQNTGPAIVKEVWWIGLSFQAAEPQTCSFQHNRGPFLGFPANSVSTVSFGPFTFPAEGINPVWAWVDCENNVVEADETNNKRMGNIIIGLPDLIVESITPSVPTPTVNQPFDVTVVLRNGGSRAAVSFLATLILDSTAQPTDGAACESAIYQYVPALDPEATATLTFSVTYSEARQHRLWAFADPCGGIPEPREENNRLSRDINVGSGVSNRPDLVIESITTSTSPAILYGDIITFDVTVRNVGPIAAGAFEVGDFALPDFPGQYPTAYVTYRSPGPHGGGSAVLGPGWTNCDFRTRDVAGLAPGAAATVQFWRHYTVAGRYSFTATADACGTAPNQAIFEGSEENNQLSIEFEAFVCPSDRDNDGICDDEDHCPDTFDPLNNDSDNDGLGDACDNDDDNDGFDDGADCDPRNPFVHPGAVEDCTDGIDNNCDGQIDEGAITLYRDADGDGFGNAADSVVDCSRNGFVANADDCDDGDPFVFPGANGPCDDGLDNDCDGVVDNEHTTWGRDTDADGFTDPNDVIIDDDGICDGRPAGYSLASAVPDPDDADFMVPEPVVASPAAIAISRAQAGRIDPAIVQLSRRGRETYAFTTQVQYEGETTGWLTVSPDSGESTDGGVTLSLTPDTASLPRAQYDASLQVTINGGIATFNVPITLTVRNPILRVVHSGRGRGRVRAEYFDNAENVSVFLGAYNTEDGTTVFEAEVPAGEGYYLYPFYDECSFFGGFYDESGQLLPDNDEPIGWGPFPIDADQTVTARFAPNYLLCGSCAFILIGLNLSGLWLTRRRRGGFGS